MGRVVHFEIHVDDFQRASDFYTKVFGWDIKSWQGGEGAGIEYWMITTGKDSDMGINGGMLKRMEHTEAEKPIMGSYVCTIGVGNIDDSIKKVTDAGGKVVVEKNPIPTMGWLCYCHDTEGNVFGMMQPDESAA
jgi:uncharacterized protein